jgi:hypothetical protein
MGVCQDTDANNHNGKEVKKRMNDSAADRKLIEYETPQVITYDAEAILEELGPAQAMGGYVRPNGPPPGSPFGPPHE